MSSINVVETYRARLHREPEAPLRTDPSFAIALGAGACLAGFVLLGPLASRGIADDADALSFLFGESRSRAPASRANALSAPFGFFFAARQMPLPAVTVHQTTRRAVAARPTQRVARLKSPLLDTFRSPSSKKIVFASKDMSPFDDYTLRQGDAVMTSKGLRIFQGARRYPFALADFRPLSKSPRVEHRNALLAIDRIIPAANWPAPFGASPPVATIIRRPDVSASVVRTIEPFKRS